MEIEQREAGVRAASDFPVGESHTQPHPQRHQAYSSTSATYYHQGLQQSPSGETAHHAICVSPQINMPRLGFVAIEYAKEG